MRKQSINTPPSAFASNAACCVDNLGRAEVSCGMRDEAAAGDEAEWREFVGSRIARRRMGIEQRRSGGPVEAKTGSGSR